MINDWRTNLKKVVREMKDGSRPNELSVPVLREIVRAPSSEVLARFALKLVNKGQIEVHYRVVSSETKTTIGMYDHLYDVPKRVFDESSDTYQTIVPSRDVEVVYSVPEA